MKLAQFNDYSDELFLDKYFPRCSNDVRANAIDMLRYSVWVILSTLLMKGYIKKHGNIKELMHYGFRDEFYVLDLEYIKKHYSRLPSPPTSLRIKDRTRFVKYIIVRRQSGWGARYGSEIIKVFATLDTSEKIVSCSIPINITDMEGTNMNIQAISIGDLDTQSLWQLSEDMLHMALDLVEYFPT